MIPFRKAVSAKGRTKETSTFTCEGNAECYGGQPPKAYGSGHQVCSVLRICINRSRGINVLEGKSKESLRTAMLHCKPKVTEKPYFPMYRNQILSKETDTSLGAQSPQPTLFSALETGP